VRFADSCGRAPLESTARKYGRCVRCICPDPTSRTSYVAGEIAQCDLWFPPVTLPVGFGQARRPARLRLLLHTGHEMPPAVWDTVVAILDHTTRRDREVGA
jgi:hypothetical protein